MFKGIRQILLSGFVQFCPKRTVFLVIVFLQNLGVQTRVVQTSVVIGAEGEIKLRHV